MNRSGSEFSSSYHRRQTS